MNLPPHTHTHARTHGTQIGGVMIMGDRGTGKSTTIRALADLLPEIKVVDKDPFNSGEYNRL